MKVSRTTTTGHGLANGAMAIIVALFLLCIVFFGGFVFGVLQGREITPETPHDWRPDIRHCLNGEVDHWDCIRNPGDYEELRKQMNRGDI